jgi:iron complex outermembrane receptor protein
MKSTKTGLLLLMLFCIGSMFAYGQEKMTVSGTIKDSTGNVLQGATVNEKGTDNRVPTDVAGHFTIHVKQGAHLIISYIGFATLDVKATPSMQIKMSAGGQTSEEVVVTALGIKRTSKALGYAVSKVDGDRIMASGTPANALQALYGAAPGVTVAATAAGPSGGMKINIRNAVSFDQNSSTRPLLVVDGVPIHDQNTQMDYGATSRDNGTGINDINPDDIASFEILKGAKASVLYGYAGANGVILITTKSGAKGKGLGVAASFTTTWDHVAFTPKLQTEYGTGSSPSNPRNDAQGYYIDPATGKRTLATTLSDGSGAAAFGPKFDPSVSLVWWDGISRPWQPQTKNIYNDLYQTGHQNTTNVSVGGANEQGMIRFSYTNTTMPGTRPGAEYDKNTFSLNTSYKVNNFITLRYTGNFYASKNVNAANLNTMNGEGQQAEIGAYSADINVGLLNQHMVTPDGYNYFASPANAHLISNGRKAVVGFLWDQTQNNSTFTRTHNIQSLTADIRLSKIFSAAITGGMDYSTERNVYKGKLLDPNLTGPNSGQMYSDVTNIYQNTYGQGMLNFNVPLNTDWNLSGFVGGIVQKNTLEGKGAAVNGYGGGAMVIPNFFSFTNLPLGVQPTYQFSNGEDLLYALVGSAQASWRNQLFLEAQGRQDYSSILKSPNNKYFYPGLSAAWVLSETFKLPEIFDYAKLRTSWADVGRPGPRYFGNVNYTVSQVGGGYSFTPPGDLPPMDSTGNPNLKPERKREYELGFETYLMKNRRLGVDFSWYNSTIYDQIMAVAAPPGMGVKNIRMNAGSVRTKGWELAIKTKPIVSKDFEWDVNLTFAHGKTVVERLDGQLQSLTLWNAFNSVNAVANVGQEYGQLYLTKSNYNFSKAGDPNDGKKVVNSAGTAYDYTSTSKLVGKMIPDVTGGFFTSFAYKNLRLIANLDYQFGGTILSGAETYMMAAGTLDNTLKYRDAAHGGAAYYLDANSNKVAGTNPNGGTTFHDGVILDGVDVNGKTNTKVATAEQYYYASYFSNGFFPEDRIFKSDYVALRNLAFDYTVSPKIAQKIKMQNLVISIFANNVAYIYKAAPNTTPESTNGTGWGVGSYGTTALPSQRSIGFSIKTKF